MSNFLTVVADDIKNLNDEQLRELVARLSIVTLRKYNIASNAVLHGGDQRSKDGGIDVLVEINRNFDEADFIPNKNTGIQVKAEDFPAGKIRNEMMPDRCLRGSIVDLAEKGGAYIMVSSKGSVAAGPLKDRLKAMEDCLAGTEHEGKLKFDYYDRTRIADWVNEYPSIVPWVLHTVGRPSTGWQSYGAWAYNENNTETPYIIDEKVKVFRPNDKNGLEILRTIEDLRGTLAQNKKCVRIVGLSGVGKTRLLQALFDKRIETDESVLDDSKVLYCDLSDEPNPQPIALVEALLSQNEECLIIVDNCGGDLHARLAEKIRSVGSRLTLATVEYDIREDQSEGTDCYRLDSSSEQIIEKVVIVKYPQLSGPAVRSIVEFSDGNARVALALASRGDSDGDLSQLSDTQLFTRIFQQNHSEKQDLMNCAEACSLLYSFDFLETENDKSELEILAELADTNKSGMYRDIKELQKRGLVQARGQWRAILPHAISNRLAANALNSIPLEIIKTKIVDSGNIRLLKSFAHRLSFLYDDENAQKLVEEWFSMSGFLSDISTLTPDEKTIFEYVAPVNPEAALNAIERAADKITDKLERSKFIESHSHLLRSIAYDQKLFSQAVRLLKEIGSPDAKGVIEPSPELIGLFSIHLSATQALPQTRADFINNLLSSSSELENNFGVTLLDSALNATNFTSSFHFDFGGRNKDWGWEPKTNDDYSNWYEIFLNIATNYGQQSDATGLLLRRMVGRNFSDLWSFAGMQNKLLEVAITFQKVDGWADGWLGVRHVKRFQSEELDIDSLELLKKIENTLRPADLETEINAKVLIGTYSDIQDHKDEDYRQAERRTNTAVHELGVRLASNQKLFMKLLPELLQSNSHFITPLAKAFCENTPELASLVVLIKQSILENSITNYSFTFLQAIFSIAYQRDQELANKMLDDVLVDKELAPFFPYFQASTPLDNLAVKRIIKSTKSGLTLGNTYHDLAFSIFNGTLDVKDLESILNAVIEMAGGQGACIHMLSSAIHSSKNQSQSKPETYTEELRSTSRRFLLKIDWDKALSDGDTMDNHYYTQIIKFGLGGTKDSKFANELAGKIISVEEKGYFPRENSHLLIPLLEAYPENSLDRIFVKDEDGSYYNAVKLLDGRNRLYAKSVLANVSVDTLINWCNGHKDRIEFIANICGVFTNEDSSADIELSDLVLRLIKAADNKNSILLILVNRISPMSWSGSRADIIRSRTKLFEKALSQIPDLEEESITKQINWLNQIAEKESKLEQARESERNGRFED